jgi:hypothetical protein
MSFALIDQARKLTSDCPAHIYARHMGEDPSLYVSLSYIWCSERRWELQTIRCRWINYEKSTYKYAPRVPLNALLTSEPLLLLLLLLSFTCVLVSLLRVSSFTSWKHIIAQNDRMNDLKSQDMHTRRIRVHTTVCTCTCCSNATWDSAIFTRHTRWRSSGTVTCTHRIALCRAQLMVQLCPNSQLKSGICVRTLSSLCRR